jgi:hypothetical protein
VPSEDGASGLSGVLFASDEWGYGTTTSALAIAEELVSLTDRTRRCFAGTGPGFQLARRAGLDALVEAETMSGSPGPDLVSAVTDAGAIVSIMNDSIARLANRHGRPCVYVDSLLWMWPEPTVPASVERYFIEWFPGAEARARDWAVRLPPHEIVGPVISPPRGARAAGPSGVLVNFGGLASRLIPRPRLVTYATTMIEVILDALRTVTEPVRVCLGQHVRRDVVDGLTRRLPAGVTLMDLDHHAYLDALDGTRVLVSSCGLHAVFEAIARGVPCVPLPSQNMSQMLTMRVLATIGATDSLDWDQLFGRVDVPVDDEPVACAMIASCVERLRTDRRAWERLASHLRRALAARGPESCAIGRESFGEPIPPFGARRVAEHVRELLEASPGVPGVR